jgi:hypothetical protein
MADFSKDRSAFMFRVKHAKKESSLPGLLDPLDRGSTVILNVVNYQTARLDIPNT